MRAFFRKAWAIRAYQFDADVHCVDCTRKARDSGELVEGDTATHGSPSPRDEHGLSVTLEDTSGNLVHPVFASDEVKEPLVCGDCGVTCE
jgi:hypothetical protein